MTAESIAANGAGDGRGPSRAVTLRGAWRLAGLLFLVGAVSTIPGTFLLDDGIEPWMYALIGIGMLCGVACLLVPWWRLSEHWLLLAPVLATIVVAFGLAVTGFVFSYLFFLIALYLGLIFPRSRQLMPLLALVLAGLFVPLAIGDEPGRDALFWGLALGPAIVLTAVVVGRLTAGLESSREAYRRLSTEDGLTGVGNYRSLIERLGQETSRHQRRGREFTLLTLDLDNFKALNDAKGHLVGDLVLALVGSMLELKLRSEDTVFRQGGDEFSVIAPETGREGARLLMGRIEHAVAQINSGEERLSASVGCAVYPLDGSEPGELLDAADAALLQRKRELGALPQRWL